VDRPQLGPGWNSSEGTLFGGRVLIVAILGTRLEQRCRAYGTHCAHDWVPVLLRSAIYDTAMRTTNTVAVSI